ncbi:MAG: MATE family efflux transporter [Bacilli bacterium]|nr:MATE family efflux transporter [Bacilli bacterium]
MNISYYQQKLNYSKYLKQLLPSIITMIFVSFYTVIDGFFVVKSSGGELALAGINIVLPVLSLTFGVAVMLSTGISAIIGEKLGSGKDKEVNGYFSFIALFLLIIGILSTIFGILFLEKICIFLGASELLMPYVLPYCRMMFIGFVPVSFKLFFEYLARTDGNSKISMIMSGIGLILNVILDYWFVLVFDLGTFGAGLGTILSIGLSGLIGLMYFLFFGHLHFEVPLVNFKVLFKSMSNGSSEMLTELSSGITTLIFNIVILKYYGENGIASITILMYLYYFFLSFYMGIAVGSSPLISYSYGANDAKKIKQIIRYSMITIAYTTLIILVISYGFSSAIINIFAESKEVYDITLHGLHLFAILFLFVGVNVFMSSYFTALGDGLSSAIISTLRSLVFVLIFIYFLPIFFKADGVFLTMPIAELLTLIFSIIIYKHKKLLI